ncbi:DNA polymerase III subunit gamma/tau [Erythrobacter sp. LQ02-29]|uniref:DNA polymerase III subunit gamma/tau n=1 Tax=Erythrobacter sp. LQ02-29 TaxID=2920384 RepID=UPI001F4E941F|nr:DNA polymerase III subunit gamma/tau [Erythrobacter sp. LQ02-29]MCP9223665.1 DNA polymerase III subunit gamma/tau [Erythrobacter sp. LQ02-29]
MGDSPDDTGAPPWEADEAQDEGPSAEELEAAGQSAMFGDAPADDVPPPPVDPKPEAPTGTPAQPYRVLARKYRPQTFSQLIGQDAMVRTLANAIERDRLAHAFLMTGVRGVGKTSTARLIAKALNCIGPDGNGGPTIDPCGVCEPCVAIAEGRHIDVQEMDAASHTGIDDVREIIEAVRYAAVSARYKIYIIDEVHMLSKAAFNGLLKTLEEPPPHVKFLFATTEVEKLPVTVLSRTQRFDLRRIPTSTLQEHFGWICEQEGVEAEDEALAMVAAAAEGSVRDGLSILDQAIAHADLDADGKVTAARVRDMLGLADKGAQRRLLGTVLNGEPRALLAAVADQYALGVEPLALMRALMEVVHRITVAQLGEDLPDATSEEERADLVAWAGRLSAGQLHRMWQMLLKGYEEVRLAPDPLVSAQMALLRLLHAQEIPDPGELARRLETIASGAAQAPANPASDGEGSASAEAVPIAPAAIDFPQLVRQVEDAGDQLVASFMRLQLRVIECVPGQLVFSRAEHFTDDIAPQLRAALYAATGQRWQVEERRGVDAPPSMVEREEAEARSLKDEIERNPLVQAVKSAFPGAELITEQDDAPSNGRAQWSANA